MIIMSKYDPLWKWINKNKTDDFKLTFAEIENKPDEFLVTTGIGYGNSKLLFITWIYLYDMVMGGDDDGNKKYYFETSHGKRNVTGRAGR